MKKFIIVFLTTIVFGILVYINIPNNISVEIKGEVRNPGVYELKKGSTIKDLIDISGGINEGIDTYTINMTRKLNEGDVIVMFNNEFITNEIELEYPQVISNLKNNNDIDLYITNEIWESEKISINTANKKELMTLSGIGESKALAIIEYREKNGLFKNIEEIKKVKGIGNGLFEKIRDYIKL